MAPGAANEDLVVTLQQHLCCEGTGNPSVSRVQGMSVK